MALLDNVTVVKLHDRIVKTIGDGPVWLEDSGELVFVDYFKAKVFKLNAATNELSYKLIPGRGCISLAYPTTVKDRFLAVSWLDIISFDWENPENVKIVAPCFEESGKNIQGNDGKADRDGRLWFGTLGTVPADEFIVNKGAGAIFCAEMTGGEENRCKIKRVTNAEPIDVANGFEWSTDNQTMFFVDTWKRVVYAFRYDASTGEVGDQRVAINFTGPQEKMSHDLGKPDGCAIDVDNKLWVAGQGGSNVCCFDVETGQLISRIEFDARDITSCAFGGSHLNQLYVTSSPGAFSDGGSIYRVDGLTTRGLPASRAKAPNML